MFEIVQLQNEFKMSERLNERDHGEVVLSGPHLDGLDVVGRQSVSGAHISERTPERKHVLVLDKKGGRSCVFQERKDALQVAQLWGCALKIEMNYSMLGNVSGAPGREDSPC